MATAALQVPSSNHILPGSHHLQPTSYPRCLDPASVNAAEVAEAWASSLNSLIDKGEVKLSPLFLKDSHWRDLLCLAWDFHTLQGPDGIASFLENQNNVWRIKSVIVDESTDVRKPVVSAFDFEGNVKGVQSFLTIETDVGRGRGLVRLLRDPEDGGRWKVFTLFTTLEELTGYEASMNARRPTGLEHSTTPGHKNWKEMRSAEENFENDLEPVVLIVGISTLLCRMEILKLTL